MDVEKGLQESDRNARAYGFEVGRGKPLTEQLTDISTDNPFMDPQWASKMDEWNERHVREDGNLVAHAKKELALLGNDKDFACFESACFVNVDDVGMAKCGRDLCFG